MANHKSLMEYICEAIDEALPPGSSITGRDIYMRGFERSQRDRFEKELARQRRELEASLPLLVPAKNDVFVSFEADHETAD